MKLAICGASWASADLAFPGASFGELLAKKNNWELLSLARGGCSNFAVALQVEEAIKLKSNFVIVVATTPDRIEIPIIADNTRGLWENIKKVFSWRWFLQNKQTLFVKRKGLANIQYYPHPDLSSTYEFLKDPTVISESLAHLAFDTGVNDYYRLTDEQKEATKLYMLNMYDSGVKTQIDAWIISNSCRKLIESKIPFLLFVDELFHDEFCDEIEWVDPLNLITQHNFNMYEKTAPTTARFHYHPDGAKRIADYLQTRINKLI